MTFSKNIDQYITLGCVRVRFNWVQHKIKFKDISFVAYTYIIVMTSCCDCTEPGNTQDMSSRKDILQVHADPVCDHETDRVQTYPDLETVA